MLRRQPLQFHQGLLLACRSLAAKARTPPTIDWPPQVVLHFRKACAAEDVREVRALLQHHQRLGRHPTLWMQNSRIIMYGKGRMLDEAFAVGEEVRKAVGALPRNTVLQLLRACREVVRSLGTVICCFAEVAGYGVFTPPYDLSLEVAQRAEGLMHEFLENVAKTSALGPPSEHMFHVLLDCQAKAGRVDAAFAAAALMQRHGFKLGVRHHTMLINACARAKPPQVERAEAQFEELLLLKDHDPSNPVPWNSMLTLYARAKHKDGGYALWQRMVGSGVTIDVFTERLLADLFGDFPRMASSMLKEARRQRLKQSGSVGPEETGEARLQRQLAWVDDSASGRTRQWQLLDLHRQSANSARLTVHEHLEWVLANWDHLQAQQYQRPLAIEINVGRGRHSFSHPVLHDAITEQLALIQLPCKPGSNPGRLLIGEDDLQQWIQQRRQSEEQTSLLHSATWRYLAIFGGLTSLVLAISTVPRILMHT